MNIELGAHAIIHFYPPTTWNTSALSRVSEVTTSIRRFGKSMLQIPCQCEMAAMLITLFRQLSSAVNEILALLFWLCVCL